MHKHTNNLLNELKQTKKNKLHKSNFSQKPSQGSRADLCNICVTQKYVNLLREKRPPPHPPKKRKHTETEGKTGKKVCCGSQRRRRKKTESVSDYAILPASLLPRGNIAWERSRSMSWLWLMQVLPHTCWDHGSGPALRSDLRFCAQHLTLSSGLLKVPVTNQ